ncbi:MAG: hypothetical protein HWD60_05690 [Defluviicoccus sp.]|nr:MAG: hypothetical protein HWD60_05690 [Defluviicoccus sp.]
MPRDLLARTLFRDPAVHQVAQDLLVAQRFVALEARMRQPDPAALQQHAVVGVRRYRDRFQPALAQQRREQPPVFRFVLAVPADPPGEVAIRRQFGDPFILPTALRLPFAATLSRNR